MTDSTTVDSSEKVARILSTEWFVDGQLMNIAASLLKSMWKLSRVIVTQSLMQVFLLAMRIKMLREVIH